jgi:hypothetical protein
LKKPRAAPSSGIGWTPPHKKTGKRPARKKKSRSSAWKTPALCRLDGMEKPAAPALGEDPALYRPGERQGRRPARHEKHAPVQAARFTLAVESSGARSDGGRSGFRENPRHRTRGVPHEELARPAFSATVTLPLRLLGKAARPARPTSGRPGRAPLARGGVSAAREKRFSGVRPLHGRPLTASPCPLSVPVVRALCPHGGARANLNQ